MAFKFNPFTGNFDDVADVAEKAENSGGATTDNAVVRWDGTDGLTIQNSSVTIDDLGNVIIPGNLTVQGTETILNTATLDVEDTNISVNVNGNDASSEGAGLTVERTGTNGSFIYEDALTSKFKLGALGSEVEVADVSSTQTLTNKTIDADNNTILDIANVNIATAAAIQFSKMEALTANRVTVTDGSGFQIASTVTDAELAFLSGVSSNIQTQLDAKQNDVITTEGDIVIGDNTGEESRLAIGAANTTLISNGVTASYSLLADANIDAAAAIAHTKMAALTANRVTVTDASGFHIASAVTDSELAFLSGVSSNIQTQLDAKLDDIGTSTDNALVRWDGVTGEAVQNSLVTLDDLGELSGLADPTAAQSAVTREYYQRNIYSTNNNSGTFNAVAFETHLVDTSGGAAQVTLPAPSTDAWLIVKDLGNADANTITVLPNAAETIDGAANYLIESNYESKVFVSDGTNWFIL